MPQFLVDEDLPRSLARALRDAGIEAVDVRDVGLRGRPDDEVFQYAVSSGFALLSGDLGFGNTLRFVPGQHSGIVIARFPNEIPSAILNNSILHALQGLSDGEIRGNLIIIEPGRVRLRQKG